MAKNKYAYDRAYYENLGRSSRAINGNTAYRLEVVEEEYEEELLDDNFSEVVEEEYEVDYTPEVEQDREPKVKLFYSISVNMAAVIMFGVLVVALVYSAFNMLDVNAEITQTEKQIGTAKTQLQRVQNYNMALRCELDTEMDRNYIYSVAVGRLGMVYPDKNQVVYYEPNKSGYVRQMSYFAD